ncbi:oligopeptide transporter, OPT family protein [Bacterioplanes sanyensis]|uniref:OPT family oligopeptide transporter n=1 Tax=Bacterioplanes sanyensis TaxID=1249553 RepID=UPI00167B36B9|nr:oligopeptide transporter, OPT family [Bacterioplanes sanyensis]GGY33524.1 oligopeptide transporter, OPT family protein [Bacterioplanes sanyensis]
MANHSAPLVPAEKQLHELTLKALLLGAFLSMLLAAANAYIGLLVGLTVSASIPAAAVSMGILRLFPRSNILENNMVQTAASAGESLVAGIIFTVPALVLMGAWSEYSYWPLVSVAVLGGVMGVAFTIPLRRALIVEAKLKFPEGVATAEVLKTGGIETKPEATADNNDAGSQGFKKLLLAAGLGAVFKALESGFGVIAGGVANVSAWLSGRFLFMGDIALSPALVGVGYIVGLNVAFLVFLGGVIGTLIGVPLNWLLNGDALLQTVGISSDLAASDYSLEQWQAIASQTWSDNRRIGVGAMIIGGIWSLIALLKPLMAGIKASFAAYKAFGSSEGKVLRTELDTPIPYVLAVALVSTIPLFLVFYTGLAEYPDRLGISLFMTALMLVFGFVFASVAGYMAGLVGSSNNPISGVTIATVIISSLILLQLMGGDGIAGRLGPVAVIYLAALICSAAAIAGDNMQDLKCGHILGATPWRQQLFQVVGVVAAAFVIPLVLQVLDAGYGIGRPSPVGTSESFLSAPQAGLMKDLSTGIFGAGIEWQFIYMGFALAVVLIVLDKIQERRGSSFRFPVLAVAVGIYLPLGLSVPIFIGGLLAHYVHKRSAQASAAVQKRRQNSGLLVASGLITGEALMGVLIAVIAAFVMPLPTPLAIAPYAGLAAMAFVIAYQYRQTMKTQ